MPSDTKTKECPFCAEQILAEAKKCIHCGSMLDCMLERSAATLGIAIGLLIVLGSCAVLFPPAHYPDLSDLWPW